MSNEIIQEIQQEIIDRNAADLADSIGASRRWVDKVAKNPPDSVRRVIRLLVAIGRIKSDQNG